MLRAGLEQPVDELDGDGVLRDERVRQQRLVDEGAIARNRSLRGESDSRPEITVLDLVLVTTAIAGIAVAIFWFLFLAGSSLPGS